MSQSEARPRYPGLGLCPCPDSEAAAEAAARAGGACPPTPGPHWQNKGHSRRGHKETIVCVFIITPARSLRKPSTSLIPVMVLSESYQHPFTRLACGQLESLWPIISPGPGAVNTNPFQCNCYKTTHQPHTNFILICSLRLLNSDFKLGF